MTQLIKKEQKRRKTSKTND